MQKYYRNETDVAAVNAPSWWTPPWDATKGEDPDVALAHTAEAHTFQLPRVGAAWTQGPDGRTELLWLPADDPPYVRDAALLAPLEAQFDQVRSKGRVRDLAEVFTHQREIDAMLDQIVDAFDALDVKFLEPACGSGNFLVEIVRRKLRLVEIADCATQEHYEHRLLRSVASVYGIDISPENVTEARARLAHLLLDHYQLDANTIRPTNGFQLAAATILSDNVVLGDTLNARDIELCDWQPRPGGCFVRVWSSALVPVADRDLFWSERIQDAEPVHYSAIGPATKASPVGAPQRRRR